MGQNAAVIERTVAVLAGGLSHEREVSLRSGRRLAGALREVGLAVREWDMDAALVERLRTDPPDAVAIALHGGEGENGSVQAVLELLGVPFVGTSAPACRRAWDKPTAKAELVRAGPVHPGLGRAAAHHVPRARRAGRAGRDGRPARAAADAQAGPGRLRARGPCRDRSGRAARGDGRLPGLLRHRAGRAVRVGHRGRGLRGARRGRAAGAAAGGDRGGGRAATTTRRATRPGRPTSGARLGWTPPC